MNIDKKFMMLAINMAKEGLGKTFPRPSVGAVIAKDGILISKARTADGGAPHAEPQAIELAGENAKGANLYVSLEPCNHFGKTPPCVDAVIASGVKKVFIANKDINPKAAGGIERIREAGIEVLENFCADEAMEVNKVFFTNITKNRPYIIVKIGSSLDGKIALENGKSKYITSKQARSYVQVLRSKVDGILVGVNTVINDNPQLNCRLEGLNKNLAKIILDTNNRTPNNSQIIKKANKEQVIIFSSREGKVGKAEVIKTPLNKNNNFVDLKFVLKNLSEKGFQQILVEGGGTVISSFIKENLVDELQIIYAPKILGGKAISFSQDVQVFDIPKNKFKLVQQRNFGEDKLLKFISI
jgi:diaminohydroxyphosphoribosylaminopyrimidine deaminase/5-amino-6-(5-phosphoribosylamino)uracil reductase